MFASCRQSICRHHWWCAVCKTVRKVFATMHGTSCSHGSTPSPSYLQSRRRAALPIVQHIRYAVPIRVTYMEPIAPGIMLQSSTQQTRLAAVLDMLLVYWCRCCHADTSTSESCASGGQQSQPCSLGRRQALALGLSTALLTVSAAPSATWALPTLSSTERCAGVCLPGH